mmetsp:Transcript_5534/g.20916  ORF Transcript_5534/g.20916 Transcript_5534/m.20916 type:complete len:138 (-) Transcript_5534:139-552(-)
MAAIVRRQPIPEYLDDIPEAPDEGIWVACMDGLIRGDPVDCQAPGNANVEAAPAQAATVAAATEFMGNPEKCADGRAERSWRLAPMLGAALAWPLQIAGPVRVGMGEWERRAARETGPAALASPLQIAGPLRVGMGE